MKTAYNFLPFPIDHRTGAKVRFGGTSGCGRRVRRWRGCAVTGHSRHRGRAVPLDPQTDKPLAVRLRVRLG